MFEIFYIIGVFLLLFVAPHVVANVCINKKKAIVIIITWNSIGMFVLLALLVTQIVMSPLLYVFVLLTIGVAILGVLEVASKINQPSSNEQQNC